MQEKESSIWITNKQAEQIKRTKCALGGKTSAYNKLKKQYEKLKKSENLTKLTIRRYSNKELYDRIKDWFIYYKEYANLINHEGVGQNDRLALVEIKKVLGQAEYDFVDEL